MLEMCHIILIYTVYAPQMAELSVFNLKSITIDASSV
jgi:hypothetical protein